MASIPQFVPGPLPRSSLAPPDALYSGLLECPMTTRIEKQIDGAYSLQRSSCNTSILTFQECFTAAASMFGNNHTFVNSSVASDSLPSGCSARTDKADPFHVQVTFNGKADSQVECASGSRSFGASASVATVELTLTSEGATITLQGPSSVYFAFGFGAQAMGDQPWTLVADGSGNVTERKLANHAEGTDSSPSIKVISNSVHDGVRTVVISRPLQGKNDDYFSFDATSSDIPIIAAVGSTAAFGFHKDKAPAKLTMLPIDGTACVCPENQRHLAKLQDLSSIARRHKKKILAREA